MGEMMINEELRRQKKLQQQQRMKAAEDARRRAQQERLYREMIVGEQLRHRTRMQEQQRMKDEEEFRRRAQQEQLYQQMSMDKELLRRKRMQEQQQSSQHRIIQDSNGEIHLIPVHQERTSDHGENGPIYRVVRGPGGKLYRIQVDDDETVKTDNKVFHKKAPPMEVEQRPVRDVGVAPRALKTKPTIVPVQTSAKKEPKRGRKVTVIVEDASDDESDQDDTKSVWRNRRPSPGQWIEPVEGPCAY